MTSHLQPPCGGPQVPFRVLYEQLASRTRRWLELFGVRERDRPDVAQNAWVAVHRNLPRLRPGSSIVPWVYTIVRRAATDHRQLAHVRCEVLSTTGEVADPSDETGAAHLEAKLDAGRLLPLVLQAIPDERRDVFILAQIDEVPLHDIAEALGVPEGTVCSRLTRARADVEAALKRLRAKEKRHLGAAAPLAAFWTDARALVDSVRELPPLPARDVEAGWLGVLERILDARTAAGPGAPASPHPSAPPVRRSRARSAGTFSAGAVVGGAIVYWLLQPPTTPPANPSAAGTPSVQSVAVERPARASSEDETATAAPSGPTAAAGAEPAPPAGAEPAPPAGAPSSTAAPAPTPAPVRRAAVQGRGAAPDVDATGGLPAGAATAPTPATTSRQPAGATNDLRSALAALDAARVLLHEGRCEAARARLSPHAARLSNSVLSVEYDILRRRLHACPR